MPRKQSLEFALARPCLFFCQTESKRHETHSPLAAFPFSFDLGRRADAAVVVVVAALALWLGDDGVDVIVVIVVVAASIAAPPRRCLGSGEIPVCLFFNYSHCQIRPFLKREARECTRERVACADGKRQRKKKQRHGHHPRRKNLVLVVVGGEEAQSSMQN